MVGETAGLTCSTENSQRLGLDCGMGHRQFGGRKPEDRPERRPYCLLPAPHLAEITATSLRITASGSCTAARWFAGEGAARLYATATVTPSGAGASTSLSGSSS